MVERDVGLYGTGILFEEPNPTGSRPRDLIGLYNKQHMKPHPVLKRPRRDTKEGSEIELTVTPSTSTCQNLGSKFSARDFQSTGSNDIQKHATLAIAKI